MTAEVTGDIEDYTLLENVREALETHDEVPYAAIKAAAGKDGVNLLFKMAAKMGEEVIVRYPPVPCAAVLEIRPKVQESVAVAQ